MKRVGRFLMDDIRGVLELPWMRIASRFESFRGFIGLIGRLYLAFLAVLIASVPAVLLNSDRDHVLGYVAASQLLVNLSWLIVAWAGSALVGVMIVSVVSELRFSVVQAAVGSSVARIATWTGRLGLRSCSDPSSHGCSVSRATGGVRHPSCAASRSSRLRCCSSP